MHELHELKERLCDELKKYKNEKLSTGTLDEIDKLAHAIKNIDKIIMSSEEEGGSYRSYNSSERSNRGGSYAEGGMSSRRRNSMGRYSRAENDFAEKLDELMKDAPNEQMRSELERLASKY